MPKARAPKEYAVILDRVVYDLLLQWAREANPLEVHAYIAGRVLKPTVYRVTHAYRPDQVLKRDVTHLTDEDMLAANKWAAGEGTQLLGWWHTHPYPKLNAYGLQLSPKDARIQVENHFTLSLLTAMFGDRCASMAAWLDHYPGGLDMYIRDNRSLWHCPTYIDTETGGNKDDMY
jgi:proteasome lid subunit RPN8/RPN11